MASELRKQEHENKTGGTFFGHRHRPLFPDHALIFSRAFHCARSLLSESLEQAIIARTPCTLALYARVHAQMFVQKTDCLRLRLSGHIPTLSSFVKSILSCSKNFLCFFFFSFFKKGWGYGVRGWRNVRV